MTTNAAGSGKFAVVCPLASLAGQLLSATATNATQTTSEFSAVTDPRDPTSTLRISSLEKTVAGPAIYFSSVAGLHYRLETTTNPLSPWQMDGRGYFGNRRIAADR